MNKIRILIVAYASSNDRRNCVNPIGSVLVSTRSQFNEAVALYTNTEIPLFVAYRSENNSQDLGPDTRAVQRLVDSINRNIMDVLADVTLLSTRGIAQRIGVPESETYLLLIQMLERSIIGRKNNRWFKLAV